MLLENKYVMCRMVLKYTIPKDETWGKVSPEIGWFALLDAQYWSNLGLNLEVLTRSELLFIFPFSVFVDLLDGPAGGAAATLSLGWVNLLFFLSLCFFFFLSLLRPQFIGLAASWRLTPISLEGLWCVEGNV